MAKTLWESIADLYINDTINDEEKFCGCRPNDCTDYYKKNECRKCLVKKIKEMQE